MTIMTVTVLPGALTLDDEVFDPHPGVQSWVPIVALARDPDAIVITVASDPTPLRVPPHIPVQAHRHPGPSSQEADEAPMHPDGPVGSPELLAGLYAGDLAALAEATRARREAMGGHAPETPAASALAPLVSMYGGDLELVMEAIAGIAPDQVLTAARHAAMAQSGSQHVTPKPVEDERASAEASQSVEDRLGGWYGGDLEALIHRD